jgi:CDP-4-dehydro-6-deoxyglucose reductase, E3
LKNASIAADIIDISGIPVRRIRLHLDHPYAFTSGQHLNIVAPDGSLIPMSIASAPERLPELELHYRPVAGAAEADTLNNLLEDKQLNITPAQGDVGSGEPSEDLFIVAGGSGAAQAFSCAEHRSAIGASGSTTVLWCADDLQDIYEQETLRAMQNVELHVCIDNRRTPENEGMLWIASNAHKFINAYVLIAGSPGFVYTVTDLLVAAGFNQQQLHADVYAYAPR